MLKESPDTEDEPHVIRDEAQGSADTRSALAQSETYAANIRHITSRLKDYSANVALFGEPHVLHERFELDPAKELAEFSKPHAKAYAVKDREKPERACIGYITQPYSPYNTDALEKLRMGGHPLLMHVLDAGKVFMAAERANKYVIIFERPMGEKLSDMLARGQYYLQSEVVKKLIAPIASVISYLHKNDLYHGTLRPDVIYIRGESVMVGECILGASGADIPTHYEPLEHLEAMRDARGKGHISTDMYALAILALDAIGELEGKENLTRPQLVALLLSRGAYITYVNESTVNNQLIDFMRGCLTDSMYDRWLPDSLNEYVKGKRFNLIPPSPPREAPRAHHFDGTDFYTRRALANAMTNRWEKAAEHIRQGKLQKWLDSMNYKDGSSARVTRAIGSAGGSGGSANSTFNHEMISRVITVLDPQGPVRYRELSAQPDYFPHLLCSIVQSGNVPMRALFTDVMKSDLAAFWMDTQPAKPHTVNPKLGWNTENARISMQLQTLGFGIERMLYEMNPVMPCMSRDYLPYYITSAKAMLITLDALARDHAEKRNFVDRHMIAFLSAKVGIRKEISIPEHKFYPALYTNPEIQALVTIARAQEKANLPSLPGLTYWAALRVAEFIEHIHSQEMRRNFSRDMQAILPQGKVGLVIKALQNKDYISRDCKGHRKAMEQYHKNVRRITRLSDRDKLRDKARVSGLRLSLSIALMILFSVIYYLLHKYTM